jgi:alpha-galactosidase
LESFRSVSELFRVIEESLHRYKKDPYSEVCICATPHSPYNMPYYDIATASDPVTPLQMRRRIKVEKAIHGPSFAVGDCYQVPVDEWRGSSVPQSFESAMGTGAQLTTFYKDLDSGQLKIWQKWFRKYRELGLSSGEYLNYYDIAFDTPEGHVVRKGGDLYYGFFADHWPKGDRIELRGLNRERLYEVYDYARDRHLGKLDGSDPFLNTGFKESLLLRLRPIGTVE